MRKKKKKETKNNSLLLEANEGFTTGAQGKPQGTKDQNFTPRSGALSTDTSGASAQGLCHTSATGKKNPLGVQKTPGTEQTDTWPGCCHPAGRGTRDGASGSFHPTHGITGVVTAPRDECPSSAEGEKPKILQRCHPEHCEPWEW